MPNPNKIFRDKKVVETHTIASCALECPQCGEIKIVAVPVEIICAHVFRCSSCQVYASGSLWTTIKPPYRIKTAEEKKLCSEAYQREKKLINEHVRRKKEYPEEYVHEYL